MEEGVVSFERAWVLLFLALPPLLLWQQWTRVERRLNLILKALMFAAIILALSEPQLEVPETKVSAVVMADTSAGVSPEDLARASSIVSRLDGARGRHWMRVIPFARTSRNLSDGEYGKRWALQPTSGEAAKGTDLEAAVRDAVAAMPGGMSPRIVLVSDGNENEGSIARAAWLARELRIPIDTYGLSGRPRPQLRVETIGLPKIAFAGEKFPIDLVITSPRKAQVTVELSAEGKNLGVRPVTLEQGTNQVRVQANINVAGAVDLAGVVRSPELGDVRFEQALNVRRPKVLFVSNDPPGTEKHLLAALEAAQFELVRTGDPLARDLEQYQMVVLNNQDLESIPPARKDAIERYVKQGGGLLVIGGERNMYNENKKVEDALDRTLPAKLAPPRTPEGTCVVLIIDKSSSMEGRKMELARIAAIGVIENLRPVDYVGVLIFDNSYQWAVPIRRAEDRTTIKRLVAGITPDGGTQIAPALSEGYRRISSAVATYRHVVLLTDGISEEGDSIAVAKEAAGKKVTISTVGLGQDVNRAYLEKVATFAKGRSYFLTDPSGLEQILLKDVMEHTGSTAVEKPITPIISKQSHILEGVGIETAPPLKGYVKFVSKPGADTILSVDKKDPLLALWQMGLGRAGVFTSDAKSRWAERWVSWQGFDKFWINLFRDLLPHAQASEVHTGYDSASGNLVVDYKLANHVAPPAKIPDIYVFGPNEFRQPIPVRQVAERAYRGQLSIGDRQGLFRVRPLEDSQVFPETGLYRQEEEMNQFGSDEQLLKKVAEFTGGRYNPDPSTVFSAGGRSIVSVMQLWPMLLGLAIALNLAELISRKWEGIRSLFVR
jgi:uncharacterized membrane protein